MIKKDALEFWDNPDFEEQKKLIAGATPWEVSEENAAQHAEWIITSLVEDFLCKQNLALSRSPEIAEIGCGVGRIIKYFLSNTDYECTGYDISPNMIKKLEVYLGHLYHHMAAHLIVDGKLPGETQFDFVYSFLVFQHIQSQAEIINYVKEINRVLVPEGLFRVQTHKGQPHPETRFGGFHGHFYPDSEAFKKDIESVPGMVVVEMQEGLGYKDWIWITAKKVF